MLLQTGWAIPGAKEKTGPLTQKLVKFQMGTAEHYKAWGPVQLPRKLALVLGRIDGFVG